MTTPTLPAKLHTGQTLEVTVSDSEYPATGGWSARLVLNPRAGGTLITVNSSADGNDHLLRAAPAATAAWAAGAYGWEIWALSAADQYRLNGGQITVAAGLLSAAAGADLRTQAERDLEAITAYLGGKASAAVESYTIAGRSLRSYPMPDLLMLQSRLRRDVAAERAADSLAAGLGGRQRLVVRM